MPLNESDGETAVTNKAVEYLISSVKSAVASTEKWSFSDIPARKADKQAFIDAEISKSPAFPRKLTVAGNDEPLSQQKTLRRQVVKALKHLWILRILHKNFSDVYGAELSILINRVEDCLRNFPTTLISPEGGESDTTVDACAQWYESVTVIVDEVNVLCTDFTPMDVLRSILKGQWKLTFEISQHLYNLGLTESELVRIKLYEDFLDRIKKAWSDTTSEKGWSKRVSRIKQAAIEQDVFDIVLWLTHPLIWVTRLTKDQLPYSVQVHMQNALKGKDTEGKQKIRKIYADAAGHALINVIKQDLPALKAWEDSVAAIISIYKGKEITLDVISEVAKTAKKLALSGQVIDRDALVGQLSVEGLEHALHALFNIDKISGLKMAASSSRE